MLFEENNPLHYTAHAIMVYLPSRILKSLVCICYLDVSRGCMQEARIC